MSHTDDSVSLDALQDEGRPLDSSPKKGAPRLSVANLKLILALFVIFVLVVSDVFTNSVLAGFGEKAVKGRRPTAWGTVLQGILLVIFYILAVYLINHRIL
jgi:hypothetical protein